MGTSKSLTPPDIGKLKANRDVKGLLDALDYNDPLIRKMAIEALGELGDLRAVEFLDAIRRDVDEDKSVRKKATDALWKLQKARAMAEEKEQLELRVVEARATRREVNTHRGRELSECPKCKTRVTADAAYCRGCGYEFETGREGVGPFTFALPVVESAYRPSGVGSPLANVWMFIFGSAVGVGVGILTAWGQSEIGDMFAQRIQERPSIGDILLSILSQAGLVLLFGSAVGLAVDRGAIIGKSRDENTAKTIGVICALIGYLAYLIMYSVLYEEEGFDSWIDLVRLAVYLCCIVIPVHRLSGRSIKTRPFCEMCGAHMGSITLPKVPIYRENSLIEALKSRDFENAIKLSDISSKYHKNYFQLRFWCCRSCRRKGFINVEATQMRYKYEMKNGKETKTEDSETRIIYSSALLEHEIEATLRASTG